MHICMYVNMPNQRKGGYQLESGVGYGQGLRKGSCEGLKGGKGERDRIVSIKNNKRSDQNHLCPFGSSPRCNLASHGDGDPTAALSPTVATGHQRPPRTSNSGRAEEVLVV